MKKIIFVLVVFTVCFLNSCKKCEKISNQVLCSENGLVRYHFPVIPDICQLSILVDSTYYIPLALDSAFLVDSLKVKLCYTFTGDSQFCGFINFKYKKIDIKAIQKK